MDAIVVSTHSVWRCCSWLFPQGLRTRRERARHFAQPPTSRRPHRRGFAAKARGVHRRCVQKKSSMTSHKGIQPARTWKLGSVSLSEGGKNDGSEEEGREEAGSQEEGSQEEEVTTSSIVF